MLDSNLVRNWCKIEWWDVLVQPHFENGKWKQRGFLISVRGEAEKLKYELQEPVIRFTYHSSHFPFGWRRIRPVVPSERCKNELTLALLHLCCKEIHHLCRWHVCTKRALSPVKSLQAIWNEQFSLHLELLFAVTCFKLLTEDLVKNDSPSKVRLLNSAGANTARTRNAFTKVAK